MPVSVPGFCRTFAADRRWKPAGSTARSVSNRESAFHSPSRGQPGRDRADSIQPDKSVRGLRAAFQNRREDGFLRSLDPRPGPLWPPLEHAGRSVSRRDFRTASFAVSVIQSKASRFPAKKSPRPNQGPRSRRPRFRPVGAWLSLAKGFRPSDSGHFRRCSRKSRPLPIRLHRWLPQSPWRGSRMIRKTRHQPPDPHLRTSLQDPPVRGTRLNPPRALSVRRRASRGGLTIPKRRWHLPAERHRPTSAPSSHQRQSE